MSPCQGNKLTCCIFFVLFCLCFQSSFICFCYRCTAFFLLTLSCLTWPFSSAHTEVIWPEYRLLFAYYLYFISMQYISNKLWYTVRTFQIVQLKLIIIDQLQGHVIQYDWETWDACRLWKAMCQNRWSLSHLTDSIQRKRGIVKTWDQYTNNVIDLSKQQFSALKFVMDY